MTEHSIDHLLGLLPQPVDPDPGFEAGLRQRLTDELRGTGGDAVGPVTTPNQVATTMEVLELETTTSNAIPAGRRSSPWRWAGAAAVVVAVAAIATAVLRQDDGPSTTATTPADPTATFVDAEVESIVLEGGGSDPYFVAANADGAWVATLAGDLIRVDAAGAAVRMGSVPEASLLAIDDSAVWIADAVNGQVLRLDPADGSVVATIETGIEVLPSTFRLPMPYGASRQFALIGGIVSDGESVWVGDRAGQVLQIDPSTNEVVDSFEVPVRPDQLQLDGEHLLIANLTGDEAAVVDTTDGEVVRTEEVDVLAGAAVHGGSLYLQDGSDGTVTRIDLGTGDRVSSEPLGASIDVGGEPVFPTGLVVSSDGVLVATEPTSADEPSASLHVLDPATLVERTTLPMDPDHGDMTVAPDGSVWLVRANGHSIVHITPQPL
jgi:outer membrane protein assembly factor BamB